MEDQQLPVQYTVVSALKLVRANWLTLLFLSAPFCVVNGYFVLGWADISQPQVIFTPLNMLIGLLYVATAAMAAVRIHRLALLDEKSCSLGAIFHISIRECRFVGWWCVLASALFGVMFIPLFLVGSLASSIGAAQWVLQLMTYGVILPICWLLARWSLVLPATALDHQPRGLTIAWHRSKPHSKSLFILIGVIPTLINIVLQPLFASNILMVTFLASVIWLFVCAVEICILSLSYQWIIQREAAEQKLENRVPEFNA